MLFRLVFAAFLAVIPLTAPAQSARSDLEAIQLLQQVLFASGASAIPVQSYAAHGTITYYWAGQPVQGPATIRVRGGEEVRLDAQLPGGPRTIATSPRGGARQEPDGKLVSIPAHNTAAAGLQPLPYLAIAGRLADPQTSVTYMGRVESENLQQHRVRVARTVGKEQDPFGILEALSQTDYWIDVQSLLVVRIEDTIHSVQSVTETYPRVLELEDYRVVQGIAVPGVVRERVAGQTTWEFRLSTIQLNEELPDEVFSLQR